MFWWILLGLFGVMLIVGIILLIVDAKSLTVSCGVAGFGLTLSGAVFLIVFTMVIIAVSASHDTAISTFIRQKKFFETVVPTLTDSDNYALTQKKIELNEWLYEAQYEKKYYSFFSLYSDKILELTEIR